jgi:hypothetical protein
MEAQMAVSYRMIPTASQFQKGSSIAFANRSEDAILKHIDWLLTCYEKANRGAGDYSLRRVILCDLFLTCNYWIKSYHERNPRMKKERYPAVLALFEIVVNTLGTLLQCGRGKVAATIDEMYGRDLGEHGVTIDEVNDQAKYFDRLQRQHYRLKFKGGLAYQYQWWVADPPPPQLVLAESSRAYAEIRRGGQWGTLNYAGFIMTVERELFMTKHWVGPHGSKEGIFHSSYTAGDRVMMAGTMLIEHGSIRGIRSDSGHYKPTEQNMANLLQALGMFGVDLRPIVLLDHNGDAVGTGLEFLHSRMSWEAFKAQQRDERKTRLHTDDVREGVALHRRHPHLKPPPLPPRPGRGATTAATSGSNDSGDPGAYN